MLKSGFLIIGGGVMGFTIALSLKRRYTNSSITLIEKENDFGSHASGRNSGVLHAGFYYTADSLKARFTREGNKRWRQYCHDKNLTLNQTGKVVVATNEKERQGIQTLLERGKTNGVELEQVTEAQMRKLEPCAKTVGEGIFSPTTSSFDPNEIMQSLVEDAREAGINLIADCAYKGRDGEIILTSKENVQAGYIINAAGLYADTIARDFNFAKDIKIFPFKGLYLYDNSNKLKVKRQIYPVPDLRNPFLGVHFTVSAHGKVTIGPTAIPALWRENYHLFYNPKWKEIFQTLGLGTSLFFNNRFGFRSLAFKELPKVSKRYLAHRAGALVDGVDMSRFSVWGKPGIRAQPVNLKTHKLEMDFLYEGDNKSFHLLNAVSPAFTCALPFSEYLVERIDEYAHNKSTHTS